MSVFPESANRVINTVFVDLLLSTRLSVPTSSLPTSFGSIRYFSSRLCTTVSAMELMSSRSPVKAMLAWPKPMVYFPLDAPVATSRSAWLTYVLGK